MVTISISLIAVFIPLLLMGGIVGRLFREFAVTLSVAIAVSMVVSLTATPMMCAHLLQTARNPRLALPDGRERLQLGDRAVRQSCSSVVLRHSFVTLLVLLATIGAERLPVHPRAQGILPAAGQRAHERADSGRSGHLVPGHGQDVLLQMVNIVAADPAVDTVIGFTGGSGGGGGASTMNQGRMFISLKPLAGAQDHASITSCSGCGRSWREMPGATLYLQASRICAWAGATAPRSINSPCAATICRI